MNNLLCILRSLIISTLIMNPGSNNSFIVCRTNLGSRMIFVYCNISMNNKEWYIIISTWICNFYIVYLLKFYIFNF